VDKTNTQVNTETPANPVALAICHVGSILKLAEIVGLRPSAVSNWLARGTTPNPAYCSAIERATNGAVRRQDLRPHDWWLIWPELAEQKEAA